MKTAEQIASRIARSWKEDMSSETLQTQIANGLKEYGELVRQRAAGVCEKMPPAADKFDCADALERMELP